MAAAPAAKSKSKAAITAAACCARIKEAAAAAVAEAASAMALVLQADTGPTVVGSANVPPITTTTTPRVGRGGTKKTAALIVSFQQTKNADDNIASTLSILTVTDSFGQAPPGILGKAIDSQLASDMHHQFEADFFQWGRPNVALALSRTLCSRSLHCIWKLASNYPCSYRAYHSQNPLLPDLFASAGPAIPAPFTSSPPALHKHMDTAWAPKMCRLRPWNCLTRRW